MVRGLQLLASVVAALCLCACARSDTTYRMPPQDVHSVLAGIDELPPVFGSDEPDLRMDSSDPAHVDWVLVKEGAEVMRFVARLEPEQHNSTRVKVELVAPSSGRFGNVDQRLKEHPNLKEFYRSAMREKIESRLEDRPFDMTRTFPALRGAIGENVGTIAAQMDAAGEVTKR